MAARRRSFARSVVAAASAALFLATAAPLRAEDEAGPVTARVDESMLVPNLQQGFTKGFDISRLEVERSDGSTVFFDVELDTVLQFWEDFFEKSLVSREVT